MLKSYFNLCLTHYFRVPCINNFINKYQKVDKMTNKNKPNNVTNYISKIPRYSFNLPSAKHIQKGKRMKVSVSILSLGNF